MKETEAALWRAIEANPDDDTARLVLADWLEEQGDVRAEALRTRCQQIGRIKEKLARLKSKDRLLAFFATHSHRYRLLPPLPVATLRALEAQFAVRLPDDYFDFLVRIAEGGAGPSYGLHPLRRSAHKGMAQPFPFEEASGQSYNPWVDPVTGEELAEAAGSTDHFVRHEEGWSTRSFLGCIALADHGCCSADYLVTTGKERGKVWEYHGGGDGEWHPTRMRFLPWYESWLDSGLRDRASGPVAAG
jgi:uncharacterized protein (TIGR02996 family)